ncbi:hypothetical protein AB0J38_25260 [Streptomyces sp. NPDC050095]|uniref:hypothetical protein n=1 Tax=unclassified Streptomyces TaxID=2593676 RepID=UPI00343ACC1D
MTLSAERTFFGLFNVVDDYGRYEDRARLIAGDLWCERPGHGAEGVEDDLRQLAREGMICRYTGCDGKRYLHIVKWARHQKIDRPSATRAPRCAVHVPVQACGECKCDVCPPPAPGELESAAVTRPSLPVSVGVRECVATLVSVPSQPVPVHDAELKAARLSPVPAPAVTAASREDAGQSGFDAHSSRAREDVASGSRTLDPGSTPSGSGPAAAPAPVLHTVTRDVSETNEAKVSAQQLLAQFLKGCAHRPPKTVVGHLGRELRDLVNEGFAPQVLVNALERWRDRGLPPSVLPSFVNEVLNAATRPAADGGSAASGGTGFAGRPAYVPWMNPDEHEVPAKWRTAEAA